MDEILLKEDPSRLLMFPVKHQAVYDMYTKAKQSFWIPAEIDFGKDQHDFESFSPDEKKFILHVLSFFAISDGLVIENLAENFCAEVQLSEARAFYAFQAAMETIHSEVYSQLLTLFCKDEKERGRLFHGFETIPGIQGKCNFAQKWMSRENSTFGERLVAFACIEGICFSSSFASIFWVKQRHPGKCIGLTTSNLFISRDEGLHTDFAVLLFTTLLKNKPDNTRVKNILKEAVDVEEKFVRGALVKDLPHLSIANMVAYVKYVANRLCNDLIQEDLYDNEDHGTCPLEFMTMISLDGKTNFFESRVTEYAIPDQEDDVFGLDEDF